MLNTPLKKISAIVAAAFLLQGCIAAVGTAAVVGGAVATDQRTVNTQFDDEKLALQVSAAINKDQQIKSEARVLVESFQGRILLLGQVPSDNLRTVAKGLAEGEKGVDTVYNELRVGQKISVQQIGQDSWITSQVKAKLLLDSRVKATDIKVFTENAEVFLVGNVTNDQANAAAEVASKISGVKKVVKVFKILQ